MEEFCEGLHGISHQLSVVCGITASSAQNMTLQLMQGHKPTPPPQHSITHTLVARFSTKVR